MTCLAFSLQIEGKTLYVVTKSSFFLQGNGNFTKVAHWTVKPASSIPQSGLSKKRL